ncbi:MAG: WXG100 family type VII secretion target [Propionibacteriales bacterium]|nr:WXG100 family type VII secretion target [Propionibacteriales bacterium]
MSDSTTVNAGAMQAGIEALSTAYTQTDSTLTTLEGELESSLNEWEGAAREAYTEAKRQWDAAADRMSQVIQKMTGVLTQISDNYQSNERNIQGSWS